MTDSDNTCIAVFDIGKTNFKLTICNTAGDCLESFRESNFVGQDGLYPYCPIKFIEKWLFNNLAQACKSHTVIHLVTVTHGATAVLLDESGNLALPALDYECSLVNEISEAYNEIRDDFSASLSPSLPDGLNLGRQLFWQQKTYPKEFAKVKTILTYPQYWSWLMTGTPASELTSLGCHTDLWNPNKKCFTNMVLKLGWDKLFPPIQSATAVLGELKKSITEKYHLPKNIQIINGIHDSNASYYRHILETKRPFSIVSSGTWTITMSSDSETSTLQQDQDCLAFVDVQGVTIATSRYMGGREYEKLVGEEDLGIEASWEDVENIILNKIFAIPCFSEMGGAYHAHEGKILGTLKNKQQKVALATLYSALMTDHNLSLIHAQGTLIIEGSFLNNPLYLKVLASLRPNQKVFASSDNSGTTLGSAMLTGLCEIKSEKRAIQSVPSWINVLNDYRTAWAEKLPSV